jgi:uncharacterized membrane protein
MTLGPVQLVVFGFDNAALPHQLIDQLRRWSEAGTVRLVDALVVGKSDQGDLFQLLDCQFGPEEARLLGLLSGALFESRAVRGKRSAELGTLASDAGEFGLDRDAIDQIADLIPRRSVAVLVLLEHLWAIELKAQVRQADGSVIAHGWITPATLTDNSDDWYEDDLAFISEP